ncbi:MAG TPA: hypothetical protein VGN17_26140 [Bryobacteraceae bacterium]|jgi:hypothetical protein
MAATFTFLQDNGAATGSPAHGTTQGATTTDCNWKNIDDATSAITSFPITAGNNSYEKFIYGKFSGTFTTISNGLWAHTAGTFGTGIALKGVVSSTFTTPSTATNSALTTDMTSPISIGSGDTVLFVATGPQTASPGASCSTNPCYTQFLITQMQTTSSTAAGATASATLTLSYDES